MDSITIKSTTQKYFLDLGMISQNEIDLELFDMFLQKLKDEPPKATPIGKEFALIYKPVIFDFVVFGSNSFHQTDFLCENITNIIFDLKLKPDNIGEYEFVNENAVGVVANGDSGITYLGLHSYTKRFAAHSPKYPLLFVVMTKNL